MNALVLSAIWGVIMMFSGILTNKLSTIRIVSVVGAAVLFVSTVLELNGTTLFHFNTRGMLVFDTFSLLFNAVLFGCVLLYFLLSGRDIEKVGMNVPDYYALLFFVLAGVTMASSFNTLLMLFLGIEIISIPLYI
ncbi:MAG: NADH-quinone oxidoreductase subunit N, partial [Chitinophagaceae bacterium]